MLFPSTTQLCKGKAVEESAEAAFYVCLFLHLLFVFLPGVFFTDARRHYPYGPTEQISDDDPE